MWVRIDEALSGESTKGVAGCLADRQNFITHQVTTGMNINSPETFYLSVLKWKIRETVLSRFKTGSTCTAAGMRSAGCRNIPLTNKCIN